MAKTSINKSSRKPAATEPVSHSPEIEVELEDVPGLPDANPVGETKKPKKPKRSLQQRMTKRIEMIWKRVGIIAARVNYNADPLLTDLIALQNHIAKLPEGFTFGKAPTSPRVATLNIGDIVYLKPKFVPTFADAVDDPADLEELKVTKILPDGKKVIVRDLGGSKLILGVFMVSRSKS